MSKMKYFKLHDESKDKNTVDCSPHKVLSHIVNYLAYFLLPSLPPNSIIKTFIYLYLKHHHSHLGLFSSPLATRLAFPFFYHPTHMTREIKWSSWHLSFGVRKVSRKCVTQSGRSSIATCCAQWEMKQTHTFPPLFRIIVAWQWK